ncbi:U-box domain-containing protein 16 [Aristolochia californica]|uniref:U-box domain-containing protein 16 n=1 Tax=Aristolochia californica TaxID=171875 RepID=UPI0035D918BD
MQNEVSDKSTATIAALTGLVRYAKCVLYGASTPRSASTSQSNSAAQVDMITIPSDFRCPISLELMRDPVVVSTGQTYDRASISRWIEAGHGTCPKTGQTLAHSNLIPNRPLKNLITKWCREMHIPFESTERNDRVNGIVAKSNKAAMEATRMTAQFLVDRLREPLPPEAANRVVHELRELAKTGSDNRAWIADAGAVALLVPLLDSDNPSLQTNAVTALLNLSILEANKTLIMEAEGGINAIVRILESGSTWEGRENAAAALLSLSTVNVCRKRIWREPRVVAGLVELVKMGPASSKRDALAAIINLAGDRESVGMLVGGGTVDAALAVASDDSDAVEEAVAVVAALAKRGGASAIASTDGAVGTLVGVLNSGTERARECAAAALVSICRRGRSPAAAELVATPGIEQMIFDLLGSGTPRARIKAATLLQICHRWAMVRRTVGHVPHSTLFPA